jgi:cytochrome c-type biogenesis protein CcmF
MMRAAGELCLLATLVASGIAAFVGLWPGLAADRRLRVAAAWGNWLSLAFLSLSVGVLATALCRRDFTFEYVALYSSKLLPWYYSLSSLWVGQAGSLLLWAWLLAVVAAVFRITRNDRPRFSGGRGVWEVPIGERPPADWFEPACGVLMGSLCFLIAVMVFAADPMAANPEIIGDGAGLSPLLQHPSMLVHPPVVFLGFALWNVPFSLVAAALWTGRADNSWFKKVRAWSVAAWAILGVGILLGAQWAYEELGWGGYWGWDPVENGSILPWISGTAALHALMVWQHRQSLKKTAVALTLVTFGLCNFSTFLTRSGIFSSLHAFSSSPIGWLFLALMAVLLVGGAWLLYRRREELASDGPWRVAFNRESVIGMAIVTLVLLLVVVLGGTLSSAISTAVSERMILVEPAFYNSALVPTALVILPATALAPLLRWGKHPSVRETVMILVGTVSALAFGAYLVWIQHVSWLMAVVWGSAALAAVSLVASLGFDLPRSRTTWKQVLAVRRPTYAGFVVHVGFLCLALGVAASSLGSQRHTAQLAPGETTSWTGRDVRFVALHERRLPDKTVSEAELAVTRAGRSVSLAPARHFHRLGEVWTTEVDIDSTMSGDFYVILHGTDDQGRVHLTMVDNPMVRWIWIGGAIMSTGVVVRLWPTARRAKSGGKSGYAVALPMTTSPPARRAA